MTEADGLVRGATIRVKPKGGRSSVLKRPIQGLYGYPQQFRGGEDCVPVRVHTDPELNPVAAWATKEKSQKSVCCGRRQQEKDMDPRVDLSRDQTNIEQ